MTPQRIAIVGAGPAGLATARAYRESGGEGKLTMLGQEELTPYRRPPLTKEFVRGELGAGELAIESDEWFERHHVRLLLGRRVSAIEPDTGVLEADGEQLHAHTIVLATGSEPSRPGLPGLGDPRVWTMRERRDSERVASWARSGGHAIVLGAGFIGCELAASLALRGVRVTLVDGEEAPQQRRLGAQAAARIAGWLSGMGVDLKMEVEVSAVRDGRVVRLADGQEIESGQVMLGMGVRPRGELAERAGLAVEGGAILTDARMRAHERVLAVGDVACAHNLTARRRLRVEHWGDALGQGEVAGRVLAGQDAQWCEVPGFWSTIGRHTIKYVAWGDGHDSCRLDEHAQGAFTVWYSRDGRLVGALTHERDEDYKRARGLIALGAFAP